jgi:hypothetical protein
MYDIFGLPEGAILLLLSITDIATGSLAQLHLPW